MCSEQEVDEYKIFLLEKIPRPVAWLHPAPALFSIRPFKIITDAATSTGVLFQDLFGDHIGYFSKSGCPADLCHGHILPRRQTALKAAETGVQQPVNDLLLAFIQQRLTVPLPESSL